jgi:hypothetical protein
VVRKQYPDRPFRHHLTPTIHGGSAGEPLPCPACGSPKDSRGLKKRIMLMLIEEVTADVDAEDFGIMLLVHGGLALIPNCACRVGDAVSAAPPRKTS